eukprot:4347448-Lingulodinium_polyedra.AAC.1
MSARALHDCVACPRLSQPSDLHGQPHVAGKQQRGPHDPEWSGDGHPPQPDPQRRDRMAQRLA